jgi:hypothetical protein
MVSLKEWGGSLYSLFHDSVQPFAWITGNIYRTPELPSLSKRRNTYYQYCDLDNTDKNTMLHVCHLLQFIDTFHLSLSVARCAATEHSQYHDPQTKTNGLICQKSCV